MIYFQLIFIHFILTIEIVNALYAQSKFKDLDLESSGFLKFWTFTHVL